MIQLPKLAYRSWVSKNTPPKSQTLILRYFDIAPRLVYRSCRIEVEFQRTHPKSQTLMLRCFDALSPPISNFYPLFFFIVQFLLSGRAARASQLLDGSVVFQWVLETLRGTVFMYADCKLDNFQQNLRSTTNCLFYRPGLTGFFSSRWRQKRSEKEAWTFNFSKNGAIWKKRLETATVTGLWTCLKSALFDADQNVLSEFIFHGAIV